MSKKENRKYELMVTLKPSLPENVRLGVQKKLDTTISESGFNILNIDVWGKKYLSFPVKKHQEGYYILYKIEKDSKNFESNDISKFLKTLSLLSEIIRYGIFSLKEYTMTQNQKNV